MTPSISVKQVGRKSLTLTKRFQIMKRDGFKCCICGRTPATTIGLVLEVDHIHPVSKGGSNYHDNLQTVCFDCNRGKRDTTLDKQIPQNRELFGSPRFSQKEKAQISSIVTVCKEEKKAGCQIDLNYGIQVTQKEISLLEKYYPVHHMVLLELIKRGKASVVSGMGAKA